MISWGMLYAWYLGVCLNPVAVGKQSIYFMNGTLLTFTIHCYSYTYEYSVVYQGQLKRH